MSLVWPSQVLAVLFVESLLRPKENLKLSWSIPIWFRLSVDSSNRHIGVFHPNTQSIQDFPQTPEIKCKSILYINTENLSLTVSWPFRLSPR